MGTAGIKECSGGGLRVLTAPGCLSLMDILVEFIILHL